MLKNLECVNPNSCFSKAQENEMLFVLLERDLAAPATIRFWMQERIRLGKNQPTDPQILEAEECAKYIETQQIVKSGTQN